MGMLYVIPFYAVIGIEGSALYVLGGVTVVGIVAAFGAGFVGGVYVTVKAVAKKNGEEAAEDNVKVAED